jgi:hypothetical protein
MFSPYFEKSISFNQIPGPVSKQVTNRSKTAVMDVTGFLCVWLGNSRAQLHDNLGIRRACTCSEAGYSIQNGNCTWWM